MPLNLPDNESELRSEGFQPSFRSWVVAIAAVAAIYFYFLIFAQFGFLQAVRAVVGEEGTLLRPIMAVMGIGGIGGSLVAARVFTTQRGRWLMFIGFVLSAGAAAVSLVADSPLGLFVGAALTGLGTGIITVTLAGMLRREVGGKKLGLGIGAGTGVAYGLCNLPAVFNAGTAGHAAMGIIACVVGWFAVLGFTQSAPPDQAHGMDYRPGMIGRWVVIFFTLVWLDSAAFYVIQHTPDLKGGTWGGDGQLYLNALVHAVAAVLAGLMLDRRWVGGTVLLAAGLLVIACRLITGGPGNLATGALLYAAGVSMYSTILVFYPARSGRVGLAALVYAVAGWGGSALGIGMAENLGTIPRWLLVAAGVLIATAGASRWHRLWR